MFKAGYFRMSLLFSAVWHVFWITIVYVIVTPTVTLSNIYSEVNFLGPILEKTAFEILSEDSMPPSETLYSARGLRMQDDYLEAEGPKRIVKKDMLNDAQEVDDNSVADYVLLNIKSEPAHLMEGKSNFISLKRMPSANFIEGPAKKRELLYRPLMPAFTSSIYDEEENFTVRLRFTLAQDGHVEMIEPVASSGSAFVDQKCIKNIKQWKFAPVEDPLSDKDWGIATLKIKIRQN